MERILEQWGAFADWTAGQPVLLQIAIGSLILLTSYLVFTLVLHRIAAWAGCPTLLPPSRPADAGSTNRRGPWSRIRR